MKYVTSTSIFTIVALFIAAIIPLPASDHVAIDGYDPVAYFTAEAASKGKASYSAEYDNAT
jgi:hypothetical protein